MRACLSGHAYGWSRVPLRDVLCDCVSPYSRLRFESVIHGGKPLQLNGRSIFGLSSFQGSLKSETSHNYDWRVCFPFVAELKNPSCQQRALDTRVALELTFYLSTQCRFIICRMTNSWHVQCSLSESLGFCRCLSIGM